MTQWSEHLDDLMRNRYPALLAYARALTAGDLAAAEDVVHDAIVRSFSRSRRFDSVAHAEAYTRKAIHSVFLDRARSRSRLFRAFSRVAERDRLPSHDESVTSGALVHGLLAELSPRERACVLLRFYDDMSLAEVADALGLSVGTVKRYLFNATEKLGATLGLAEDDGGHASISVIHPGPRSRKGA